MKKRLVKSFFGKGHFKSPFPKGKSKEDKKKFSDFKKRIDSKKEAKWN